MGTGKVSTGTPTRLRSFDPIRLADLEYRAWVGYYLRNWPQVLRASIGLVRLGFGMDWFRTLHGAWLVLRANQLWAPYPDNNPKRARACMRRFYALVRLTYGEPSNPAKAAELEVDWWRVHREIQHEPGATPDELVESLVRLYCYLYREPEEAVRPAAVHRATGDGPVRPVGRGRLPARQPPAPARARRPGPGLRRPPRRRPPLIGPVSGPRRAGTRTVPSGRPAAGRGRRAGSSRCPRPAASPGGRALVKAIRLPPGDHDGLKLHRDRRRCA